MANIVYLEAPVGVGFSWSERPELDYNATDDTTANDSTDALNVFFMEKFPELRANGLYITGESYGGVYLAESILYQEETALGTVPSSRVLLLGMAALVQRLAFVGVTNLIQSILGTAFIPNSLKNEDSKNMHRLVASYN